MQTVRKRPKVLAAIALVVLLGISVFLHQLSPAQIDQFFSLNLVSCPLKKFTGLQCAFCGMTHAWISVFHFRFAEAWSQNILSIPLLLGIIGYLIGKASGTLPELSASFRKHATLSSIGILIFYAIARNL